MSRQELHAGALIPLPTAHRRRRNRCHALLLAIAAIGASLALPAAAQMDIQQFLQGLTTGNQREDDALRNAFERGRRDEAQRQRAIREQRRDDRSAQREWEREEAWRENQGGNRR